PASAAAPSRGRRQGPGAARRAPGTGHGHRAPGTGQGRRAPSTRGHEGGAARSVPCGAALVVRRDQLAFVSMTAVRSPSLTSAWRSAP
ncbi:hypothetical protein SAM9427_24465, partial [Streptomyces sp. ETH9427]